MLLQCGVPLQSENCMWHRHLAEKKIKFDKHRESQGRLVSNFMSSLILTCSYSGTHKIQSNCFLHCAKLNEQGVIYSGQSCSSRQILQELLTSSSSQYCLK